jgi:tetratricopeptide (TPR) repeat protein
MDHLARDHILRSSGMPRRSKADVLLDFEITFYEKLLRAYPDFVDALIPLGDAYTRRGRHDKGLEVDLRMTRLRSEDPLTWYNLACSSALLSRLDEAIGALRRAVELGYTDFAYLQRDPDLANLRRSPAYRQFLESLWALATSRSAASRPTSSSSGASHAGPEAA